MTQKLHIAVLFQAGNYSADYICHPRNYLITLHISLLVIFSSCYIVSDCRRPAPGESGSNANTRKSDVSQCSLYMKELQGFIARAANNYLAPFQNQEIVAKW
jgi:hypothetical protein